MATLLESPRVADADFRGHFTNFNYSYIFNGNALNFRLLTSFQIETLLMRPPCKSTVYPGPPHENFLVVCGQILRTGAACCASGSGKILLLNANPALSVTKGDGKRPRTFGGAFLSTFDCKLLALSLEGSTVDLFPDRNASHEAALGLPFES